MNATTTTNRDRRLGIGILIALFVLGAVLGQAAVAPATALPPHPCQEQECKGFWFFDWCSPNEGGGQTYCNTSNPNIDCYTDACNH